MPLSSCTSGAVLRLGEFLGNELDQPGDGIHLIRTGAFDFHLGAEFRRQDTPIADRDQ